MAHSQGNTNTRRGWRFPKKPCAQLEKFMELQLNQKSFKAQAKKLHNAMKARGIECRLSDALESLAISYGYENLATLYGKK
jgi:hypothetical protein